VDGRCGCRPTCSVATCGADDGCGEACAPCPRAESCPECPLKLSVVERLPAEGPVRTLTLALDYAPGDNVPLPAMADLRLRVGGDASLRQVGLTPEVMATGKELLTHPHTGQAWQVGDDGIHRVTLLSMAGRSESTLPSGRWLLLRFSVGGDADAVRFALVEREETFAPAAADLALWGSGYGEEVVVWRQEAADAR